MAITTYAAWVKDGSPIHPAVCIADWINLLRGHGYVVGYYPDDRHLHANPPEDHTPYSNTPWPGSQPYPNVLASDLMPPTKPGLPTLAQIGARVVADKKAGVPGTEWIKYINWTDAVGKCWHESWEPTYSRTPSTDKGHIHVSARTDYVYAHHSYDPVARILGDEVSVADVRTGMAGMFDEAANRSTPTGRNLANDMYKILQDGLPEPTPVPVVLTPEDRAAIIADLMAAILPEIRDAIADLGEGGAKQVREDAP